VTRLGEFSPLWRIFSLGVFWKIRKLRKFIDYFFPKVSVLYLFWQKTSWDTFWATFSQTHLGHPVPNQSSEDVGPMLWFGKIHSWIPSHYDHTITW
jgi:hypothetical protein